MMFGHNEITLRLPSIVYSLGTVSVCFIGPFYFLKKRKLPNFYILLACLVIALFAINNSTEIRLSVGARHYSFASFTSVLWVSIFLFYEGKNKHYLFAFGSFLFLNVHFFAMPLILGGYAYIMTRNIIRKEYKEVMISMLFFAIVFVVSFGINHQSFFNMIFNTAGATENSLNQSFVLGLDKYNYFMKHYMYPVFSTVIVYSN